MNFTREDIALIRRPLLVAGALCSIGLLMLAVAIWRYTTAVNAHSQESVQRASAVRQVVNLREDTITARRYYNAYMTLIDQGALGDFSKTAAIDQFESAFRDRTIPVRSFVLSPRIPVESLAVSNLGRYSLGRYELKFRALPLHEVELIDLSMKIRNSLRGVSALESCSIKRTEEVGVENLIDYSEAPRLQADCTAVWYAFSERSASEMASGAAPDF